LVIAVQTFCLLFLRREWSDRTCHIIHIASWAFLLFELCIEHFVRADPEKGPYYGISSGGHWCWISPQHHKERYTTDFLFMIVSATFSLILYSFVFFRLRGNISVSGCKITCHRRPKIRSGKTSDGTLIVADDRCVKSYLDTVAKHMLWYPIVYIVIILPTTASRFSTYSNLPVPFEVTIFAAAVFLLHGFFNTLLFCTTRNILPGSWMQRFSFNTTRGAGREVYPSSRENETWSAATRTVEQSTQETSPQSGVWGLDGEKDVGIMREAEPMSALPSSLPPSLPSSLPSSSPIASQ
jgi:hypothetical protein